VSTAPLARIPVGVVVERRRSASPWLDFTWRPVAALPGRPDTAEWTVLSADGDVTAFYSGGADIALYRTEANHYRDNLASDRPSLWVALRPSGGEPPYRLAAVTADPAEGESFTQAGDDVVEAVPMPAPVRKVIEAFVTEHYVDQPFYKRERDRADPHVLVRRGPAKDQDK
jgi:hypothetical protein